MWLIATAQILSHIFPLSAPMAVGGSTTFTKPAETNKLHILHLYNIVLQISDWNNCAIYSLCWGGAASLSFMFPVLVSRLSTALYLHRLYPDQVRYQATIYFNHIDTSHTLTFTAAQLLQAQEEIEQLIARIARLYFPAVSDRTSTFEEQ